MKAKHNFQELRLATTLPPHESDEGGLELGQILVTLRRRVLLIAGITIGVAALAALKAFFDTPVYRGQFEILTEPTTVETVISSSNTESLSSQENVVAVKADEVKIKILKSLNLLTPLVKQLKAQYPEISYSSLFDNLSITPQGKDAETEILSVTYQDANPDLVKSVLDLVSKAYLDYSLQARQTGVRRGIEFVERQLPNLRSRVQVQQERLQKIRQQNNLVDPQTKGQELSSQISIFGQQQLETQIQLNEAKALYANLQKELTRQGPESATSALFGNSRYQSLLTQLLVIDNQLATNSVLLLEKSPEMAILRQQRQNLLTLIRREGQQVAREMANSIQGLETRNQILTLTLDRLNRDVKKLSEILREYNDIQQELQIANNNLNQFLSKREALRIDAAQKEVPWQLLTPPGEPEATPVSLKRNLLLGAVLGLLLGVGTAILLDKLGDILHTSKQVKEVTQLPILGAIPYEKELRKLSLAETCSSLIRQVSSEQSNGHKERRYVVSPFCEAFRFLYTNIRFLSLDTPIRSLIVSSATVAEGKSTVAIYLAQAAAAMGQRVLLVDADLRYPSIDTYLNLTDDRGLTHLLSSSFSDFNSAIQRSPLEDNLFVLAAGLIASDPIKLLASQKMQDLMEELENAFDLVIYKAPSLMGFADTHLLSAQTNGVLLVAGLGILKRSLLKQALDELRISGTSILGIVANSTKDASHRKFPDGRLQRGLELINLPQYASSLPLHAEKISR